MLAGGSLRAAQVWVNARVACSPADLDNAVAAAVQSADDGTGARSAITGSPAAFRPGYPRPILHGLCTFGFTGRALLHSVCNSDPARFKSVEGRWEHLTVRRLGPSEVELDPFPFAGDRLDVEVACVHLDRTEFGSHDELRNQLAKAPLEIRKTIYEASARRSA